MEREPIMVKFRLKNEPIVLFSQNMTAYLVFIVQMQQKLQCFMSIQADNFREFG